MILALYGLVVAVSNEQLGVFEDEAAGIIVAGSNSPLETIALFLDGEGNAEHPPLYDLILHAWMRVTDGARPLLRVPSILFHCLALWLVAATAQRLWQAGLLAVLLGIAWPAGWLLGTPAHWSSLAMLCVAGVTFAYVEWRETHSRRALIVFTLFAIALVYTNYFGFAILFALALHLLVTRPGSRPLWQAAAAGLAVLVAFLPLVRAFAHQLGAGSRLRESATQVLASGVYHGYSLLVSETVAPWYWPAIVGLLGIAALLVAAARTREPLWILALLALVFVPAVLLGIVNGRRLGLFGPWLILYLTGLLATTRMRRTAVVAVVLIFGTGWAGQASQRWWGTFRYVEPWEEVAARVIALSRPGDLIVCDHPSFRFYAHYELGGSDWRDSLPSRTVVRRSQRDFANLLNWKDAVAGHDRIFFLRSVVMPWLVEEQDRLEAFLSRDYRVVSERKYLEDRGSALKSRFLSNQPRWRIEMREYERAAPRAASP